MIREPPGFISMIDVSQSLPELCRLPGCHEPFSAVSHLAGAVIFVFLGALLLRRGAGDRCRLVFLGVYAVSCVLLFAMSGIYHMMVRGGTPRQVFERLDHSAIFVLVAGTFTPIHGILLRGWLRWGPLVVVWAGAIAGVCLKTVFLAACPDWLGLTLYLVLGWSGSFAAVLLALRHGLAFIKPILLGGLAYSVGGVIDLGGWPVLIPGWIHSHEVFHIAVLFGALFHWRFIWTIALGDISRSIKIAP